jgi:hypothetical protein
MDSTNSKIFGLMGKLYARTGLPAHTYIIGLQQTLKVEIDQRMFLPHACKMESNTVTRKIIQNKVKNT